MKRKYDTLVLNRIYMPIHIVSWKRSISLLYQNLAHSLDEDLLPYDYKTWMEYTNQLGFDDSYYTYIHSVSVTIAVPDILVLKKYDKLPRRDVKFTRENIIHRDKYKCAYCGKKLKQGQLTIDHITPKSKGGTNSWTNTISACKACNNKKGDRTPQQANMPLLFQPLEPRWTASLSTISGKPNIRPNWLKFLNAVGL